MKLINRESLSDVFEKLVKEKEELEKVIQEKFKKTVIKEHSEEVQKHLNRINELNLDIEKRHKI